MCRVVLFSYGQCKLSRTTASFMSVCLPRLRHMAHAYYDRRKDVAATSRARTGSLRIEER